MENYYSIAGEVNVPEEKKEELNRYVLEVLYRTGIRKTEKLSLDGQARTVVNRPVPDTDGIVRFDYSIFEKYKREAAEYNTHTCQLNIPDDGYNEFAISMNLVMVLLEEYSGGSCYFTHHGKPDPSALVYRDVLYSITGVKFHLAHRCRPWDMMLFFHRNHIEVDPSDLLDLIPYGDIPIDIDQMVTVLTLDCPHDPADSEYFTGLERNQIPSATNADREALLSQTLHQLEKEKPGKTFPFLKRLLDKKMDERKEIAKRDDGYGIVAELSLYIGAPTLMAVFCTISGKKFWETWDSLGITGYTDNFQLKDDKKNRRKRECREWGYPFYKAIQRENEDEFLEFRDGGEMKLSAEMEENLRKWKKLYDKMGDGCDIRMGKSLSYLLGRIDRDWYCRYPDGETVKEFIENQDNMAYKKAVALAIQLMDGPCRMFPELTLEQAHMMVRRGSMGQKINEGLNAYLSVLANRKLRHRLFVF